MPTEWRHRPALALLLGLAWPAAQGEEAPATSGPAPAQEVVVIGQRASLDNARARRRDSLPILDAVVADDMLRLPDFSVGEALQRVTGVQILRDRGESGAVTVRGLTQIETTLNGREVFTAGTGRTLDLADIPAEMVAGIDVYKSASANQVEGGVGGLVDIRTRRPFDFAGRQVVASTRWIHGDLARRDQPQYAAQASQRWGLGDGGELGALVAVSLQDRPWREDQKATGTPLLRGDIAPGATVAGGTSETTSIGTRQRRAVTAVLQWHPSPGEELYAEAAYESLQTRQDSHQVNVSASPLFDPQSVRFFPGSNEVQRITWLDAPVSILSFARDTRDRNQQVAVGGQWRGEEATIKADLSHARSDNRLFFSGPFFGGTAVSFTQDLTGRVPQTSVAGTDLGDPAQFRYTGLAYRTRPFRGTLDAGRVDVEVPLGGPWHTLQAGLRSAHRRADNAPGLIFADVAITGVGAADKPGFVTANPFGDFFPGSGIASLRDYMVGNLALARDTQALRAAFGIDTPIPEQGSPLGLWWIRERTDAGWVQALFDADEQHLDGQFGVRGVRTHESMRGNQSVPSSGAVTPILVDSVYTDWLPSASLRWRPALGWTGRAAASKTLTRPNFDQLSPSLSLLRNAIDPHLNQGFAGNPALRPVRSDNLDLAVERDWGRAGAVSLTGFIKWVDGFIANGSVDELHDGETYRVTRPYNSLPARVQGLELGGQWFFVDLPGPWSGLGLQASYTYVDSQTPNAALAARTPLFGLSRNSANVIGLYEYGPLSARLAWNWRDHFLSGTTSVAGVGVFPAYTQGYGWLDASAQYRLNSQLTLAVEGGNLTRTMRRSSYGSATRPQAAWLNDRQVTLAATLRL